jgi:DNA polymerase III epsilon subunit-like protein
MAASCPISYLVIDTETTGLPSRRDPLLSKHDPTSIAAYDSARLVSVAWIEARRSDNLCLGEGSALVRPEGFGIPPQAQAIHGISTERALTEGQPFECALGRLIAPLRRCSAIVGHNVKFDIGVLRAELLRRQGAAAGEERGHAFAEAEALLASKATVCTMSMGRHLLGLRRNPRLGDLHRKLFGADLQGAHDAAVDTLACYRCLAAMAPGRVFEPGCWTVTLARDAETDGIRLEVLPAGWEASVRDSLLHRASVTCATWPELCGLARGACAWAAKRYPEAPIETPGRLRWGSEEFVFGSFA